MPEIRAAQIVAFYLFDVAERADLQAVPPLVAGPAVPARLAPKPATPAYVQYGNPPLSFEGEAIGAPEIRGLRVRVRVYEYGVLSIALSEPFAGSWADLLARSHDVVESVDLETRTRDLAHAVAARLRPALIGPRDHFLSEDYVVFALHELDARMNAERLLEVHGPEIATLLRAERQELSAQERARVLAHRISYLADDLVVPTWNTAFIFDTPAGARAGLEILEFANSQLLEYRHYDQLLDAQLASIYTELQHPKRFDQWLGGRYSRAARRLHSVFIDVNELTDRTENTLKFIGDLYAVRLFGMVGDRLGLGIWKAEVAAKLKTLDDIYRFAVEQTQLSRGNFLELTIVLILVLELVLLLMGIMQ